MSAKLKELLDHSRYAQFFNLSHLQSRPPLVEASSETGSFYHFRAVGSKRPCGSALTADSMKIRLEESMHFQSSFGFVDFEKLSQLEPKPEQMVLTE